MLDFFYSLTKTKKTLTYKNPTINLLITNNVNVGATLEQMEATLVASNVETITFFRPLVSAKYPHMYEGTIIPVKEER